MTTDYEFDHEYYDFLETFRLDYEYEFDYEHDFLAFETRTADYKIFSNSRNNRRTATRFNLQRFLETPVKNLVVPERTYSWSNSYSWSSPRALLAKWEHAQYIAGTTPDKTRFFDILNKTLKRVCSILIVKLNVF